MSKQTLATCIAKMYEGSRLENSGTPSGTVKKPSPTLIGSLSNVEVKLNNLEGKVEQIERTQTEVLHKLSLLCQGMEALERSLLQHKQCAQESNGIKNSQRESNKLPLLTEVRSLCGETVDLLHNLKQESQQQRKKIECVESSLSTLEKVIGYVGDAFRNSKIVEFILNGVVPWRRQGLLDTVEEEVSKIQVIQDFCSKKINRKIQRLSDIQYSRRYCRMRLNLSCLFSKLFTTDGAVAEKEDKCKTACNVK